jgi:hypothetical protein
MGPVHLGSGIRGRIHDALLHDEANLLEASDVREGVPGHGDDVGQLAGFDRGRPSSSIRQATAAYYRFS